MTRAKQFNESVSLNPSFMLALTAVIGQMAQFFVIGLPRTAACLKLNAHCHNRPGDLSIHRKDGMDCTLPIRARV